MQALNINCYGYYKSTSRHSVPLEGGTHTIRNEVVLSKIKQQKMTMNVITSVDLTTNKQNLQTGNILFNTIPWKKNE